MKEYGRREIIIDTGMVSSIRGEQEECRQVIRLEDYSQPPSRSFKSNCKCRWITFSNSAHHFDLRQPNTCDPSNVPWIRFQVGYCRSEFFQSIIQAVKAMRCFIDPTQCTDDLDILDNMPSNMPTDQDLMNCKDIVGGYPWGQTDKSAHALFTFTTFLVVLANVFRM